MVQFVDYHTHTTFSDGSEMDAMVRTAERANCAGIGLSDHCILIDDPFGRRERFDLVETYGKRRERIEALRTRTKIPVYDAVELSYVPGQEARIRAFLEEADFCYAIGSVHFADGFDFTSGGRAVFLEQSIEERRDAVEAYYETLVQLIESELFEIVGHLDLPERVAPLRGLSTEGHYRRLAEALSVSSSVPELNAGRALRGLNRVHPDPSFVDVFAEHDVEFVLGTDAHSPDELERRAEYLDAFLEEQADFSLTSLPVSMGASTLS